MKTRLNENPNQQVQSFSTFNNSIPSIINTSSTTNTSSSSNKNDTNSSISSSNTKVSSSTASSSISSSLSSTSPQKAIEGEEKGEEIEKKSNTDSYQASFLSANSSISGILASLGKSGLAKGNLDNSAKQSEGNGVPAAAPLNSSGNKN